VVEFVTGLVDTVRSALVAPAATVTPAGTVATVGLLLESATTAPPAGAAVFRVTVPIRATPPATVVGLRLNEERVAGVGVTVSTAELESPAVAPETSTLREASMGPVDTTKSALVAPPAILTRAGTATTLAGQVPSSTSVPSVGAGAFSVTVPVDGLPPTTVGGFRVTEEMWDQAIRPVGSQVTPPFELLYTPLVPVPAYRVVGVRGSIASVSM
jgi:hypothetical protein